MRTSLAALVLSFAFAQPSLGGDQGSVVGTWKLVSYEVEAQASGERGPVMGQSPTGYAAFLPDGRVFFMLTGEARKPSPTPAPTGSMATSGRRASRWPGIRSGSAPSRSVPSSSKASAFKS
jgi:hypothetical protein